MQGSSYHEPDKSNVLLTELVIVILFFALTAVTVMQLFVAAHLKSQHNVRVSEASIMAQDVAERLSGERMPGDVLLQNDFVEGEAQGEYIREVEGGHTAVRVSEEQTGAGALVISKIEVFNDAETRIQLEKLALSGSGDAAAIQKQVKPLCTITAMTYCPDEDGEVGA